ncbi:TetR/AcrR family transcriptional regulator [Xenophilus aerolatus]|nr:TetR/AcrR family transcriptional regulator [Xenophilus aerolatus]
MSRWNNLSLDQPEIHRLKREALLREAGNVISARGYHYTSLDDIAKALGVSKGALYHYVKDKQEILWELHRRAAELSTEAFKAARQKGGTGAEVLRNVLLLYIRSAVEELGACSVLMEFDALRPEDQAAARKLRDAVEDAYVEVLELGFADGSIRVGNPRLMTFTFMGAVNWIPRWYSPSGRLSSTQISELMTTMLLQGLLTRRAPEARPARNRTAKGSASPRQLAARGAKPPAKS